MIINNKIQGQTLGSRITEDKITEEVILALTSVPLEETTIVHVAAAISLVTTTMMVVTAPAATSHPVAEDSMVDITTIEGEMTTTILATPAEEEAVEMGGVAHLHP